MQFQQEQDIVAEIKKYIAENLPLSKMSDEELEEQVENITAHKLENIYCSIEQRVSIVQQVYSSIRGFGLLDSILTDDTITEVMINGPDNIFIEQKGRLFKMDKKFESQRRLEDIIQRIVGLAGREVNQANPICDTRLPDGSRVNVVLPPIALCGPTITIRKFSKTPMTIERLIQYGSLTQEIADKLELLVRAKFNIFICGGTGSGKTTFLNALSNYIPHDERVITIEDSAELQITGIDNLVSLETRNANASGAGQITIRDLIKSSLRMRPERIVVGEVRGGEALDMLQAMNTGHDGSLSTGHANSTQDMLSRLETMVLQGAAGLPLEAIRQQIASAVDIIIHLSRLRDKSRKTMEITEVVGYKDGQIILNPLYVFEEDENSTLDKVSGSLKRTSNPMINDFKLKLSGIKEQIYKNKKSTTSTKTTGRNISNIKSSLPSGGAGGSDGPTGEVQTDSDKMNSGDSSKSITQMLDKITNYITSGEIATDFRDNLYITDYVMGMFTYDTYEAELSNKYGNGSTGFDAWYEESDGKYALKDAYKTEAAKALSLTKNKIDPNNHYLYGAEAEYIIYGGDNPYTSATNAYGAIFLIRFGFNTVYAFQDTSIRGVATSLATSLFGTPPLTPLIPVAKIAITLGFSIAESAYDLYQLKCGEAVPIIKKADTFVMSPANITKEAGQKLVDAVGNEVDKITNSTVDKLTELMNKTDEELQDWINSENLENLVGDISDSLVEKYTNYSNEVVEQLVTTINNVNLSFSVNEEDSKELTSEKKAEIKKQLKEWVDGKTGTDELLKSVYDIAYDCVVNSSEQYIDKMFGAIQETSTSNIKDTANILDSKVNELITNISGDISEKISDSVKTAGTKLSEFKDTCAEKLREAANQGAEKLKEELTNQIGNAFGDSEMGKQASSNSVANFTSWRYSDYLTLFLMISLFGNQQNVISRIADVIQMNMEKSEGKLSETGLSDGAFLMKNACTHINIEATVEVKPLMMALPFMAETTKSQLSGTTWYTVKYKGTAGY